MRSKVSKENMERKARNSLMIAVIVIISAVVVCSLALSIYYGVNNDRFSGYVYEAGTNTPLAGVAVTNGHEVVKTDEQGRFVIDGWYKTRFITVTIPSGYWTENYYIETTRAKKGYDFYLDKQEKDLTDHSFLQVTDTEINSEGAGAWVDEVRDTAKDENAAFIIHTGDICYEDGLKQHIKDMNTQNMGVPVRYVIGNHDYVKWGKYSEDLFESTYGPVNYSFDVGNIHYVVTAITKGDYPARYQRWDVWRWLANDLAQVSSDKKVVIFNHDYCPDENGFVVKYGASKLDLRRRGLIAWVFGHWHYSYLNDIDGILNVTTSKTDGGGIDSTPAATRVMSFKGGSVESSKLIYRNFKESSPADGFEWTTKLDGGHGEFAKDAGATQSSARLVLAVQDALLQAKGDVSKNKNCVTIDYGTSATAYGLVHRQGYVGIATITVKYGKIAIAELDEACFPTQVKANAEAGTHAVEVSGTYYWKTVKYDNVTMVYDATDGYKVGDKTLKQFFADAAACEAYAKAVLDNRVSVETADGFKTDIMTSAALLKSQNGYWETPAANALGWTANVEATCKYVVANGFDGITAADDLKHKDGYDSEADKIVTGQPIPDKMYNEWLDKNGVATGATWTDMWDYVNLLHTAYNKISK